MKIIIIIIIIIIIYSLKGENARNAGRQKNQGNRTKLVQLAIFSFIHRTPLTLFFLHFGGTSFGWAHVKNAWASPKNFLSLPSYQTTPFPIFFPIFSTKFLIYSISSSNKHSLRASISANVNIYIIQKTQILHILPQKYSILVLLKVCIFTHLPRKNVLLV